jgi:hypothetical protein
MPAFKTALSKLNFPGGKLRKIKVKLRWILEE